MKLVVKSTCQRAMSRLLRSKKGKGGNKTSLTQVLVPVGLYLNKAQNVGKL